MEFQVEATTSVHRAYATGAVKVANDAQLKGAKALGLDIQATICALVDEGIE
jgi:hypothetical protein